MSVLPPASSDLIRRERRLPIPGQVMVAVGSQVSPDTLVAKAEIIGPAIPVNIAARLEVNPEQIERYLLKRLGEPIAAGEPLALMSGFFGLSKSIINAPRSGVISSISTETGIVVIQEPSIFVERYAYLPGKVVSIIPNEGVIIEAAAKAFTGAFGVGGERFGRLLVLSDRSDAQVKPESITEAASGAIVLAGASISAAGLKRAARLGVAGVIVGSLHGADLADYLGYEIGVPITGQETVATTVIAMEGFGEAQMSQAVYDELVGLAGRVVSINGTTHLRSHLLKPEVIVALA